MRRLNFDLPDATTGEFVNEISAAALFAPREKHCVLVRLVCLRHFQLQQKTVLTGAEYLATPV